MRAFLIAAGIAVALFMAPVASAQQIGGASGVFSASGAGGGGGGGGTSLSKTVVNMNFGSDQFANIAKGFAPTLGNGNTPANLSNDEFPSGVLPGTMNTTSTGLPGNYYGHYTHVSTGISAQEWGASIIVYSGGLQVFPSLTSGFGTSIQNTTFINNGAWNVEFAFGDTIATVQNSSTTPGLVELVASDANGFTSFTTGGTIQVHNVSNLSATTVWTITKINSTTIDLQGSVWSASMVPATGNPGTAAEAIYSPSAIAPTWAASLPTFGTVTHTITSEILCKTADLASVQAGNNVSSAAISFITTLKPKWLRFMDMIGVQAVSGQFQYLPALTNASFVSTHWLPAYYGGSTSGTGDAFTVNGGSSSPASGPYADGEVIQFKADHSSTDQIPTLSINGRSSGAKPVYTGFGGESNLGFGLAGQSTSPAITSIVGNGTTATVTTTSVHGWTTGQTFITNIGGATPSGFNASNVLATATGTTTFTYTNATNATASVPGTYTPQVSNGDIINLVFTASNFSGGAYTVNYYVNTAVATFTGTVSGKILTVSGASGTITPGQVLTAAGLTNSPMILPYGNASTTGTGGNGTYALDEAPGGTTTITGATGQCGGGGLNRGPITSISSLSSDLTCYLEHDVTLGAAGYQFGNGGGGPTILYPAGAAVATPSSTITAVGGAAEVVTPSWGGALTSGTIYTAQYRALTGGWVTNSGALQVGIPLGLMKEFATRGGAGIWYTISPAWTQTSAKAFGAYASVNWPGIPVAGECGNEMWNTGENPNHVAQNLGTAMGFAGVNDGSFFQSVYGLTSWCVENLLNAAATSYLGNSANFNILSVMSGADGMGQNAGGLGGQTLGVQTMFLSTLLTPTPATFTGTITPNTNGLGATLTVTGLSTALYSGYQITGSGVTPGTTISTAIPATSFGAGNGTYQLNTTYGSTVGPVAMTAHNVTYSAVGGPGATPTTNDFTTFPNRTIDISDGVGYATYFSGAIAQEGAGSWSPSHTSPAGSLANFATLLQASSDYAQGVATSNNTLIQSALNAWSADVNGTAVANKLAANNWYTSSNICWFLSSPTTFGFCGNAPSVVMTATTGGTATLTVTNVASGVVAPGMVIAIGGDSSVPVIMPYGTNGTTGTGGTGTYALSVALTLGSPILNSTISFPIGPVQGWENLVAAFDGARPSGKPNLSIFQYEGSIQQAFCAGACGSGNIILSTDLVTLASQFTSNGWNLDPTYGYPSFGSGNTVTATNVITLFLAYVNSPQYYSDELFFLQSEKTIHAARPYFGAAQYGIEGPASGPTTGAPQWGMLPGNLSTPPLQNYFAQQYINTHLIDEDMIRQMILGAANDDLMYNMVVGQ